MKLNRTGSNWNELERNKINENWDIIEGGYNDVVGQITDEVVGHLIDSAKLIWKEPVDTYGDLPTNAEVGETRMVRESDDGVSHVYRYNGEKWELIQEIDVSLVNEVDRRLTAQLADEVQRSMNKSFYDSLGSSRKRKPIMTIVDDDGKKEFYELIKPVLEEFNVPIASALITKYVSTNDSEWMNEEQIRELHKLGAEFVSHTHTHKNLSELLNSEGAEAVAKECGLSREWLLKRGYNADVIVYPFGQANNAVINEVAKYFRFGVKSDGAGRSEINTVPIKSWDIQRVYIDYGVDLVKQKIDEVIANNGWINLGMHVYYEDFDVEELKEVIRYALSKGVEIVTYEEAVAYIGNYVEIGTTMHNTWLEGAFIDADGNIGGALANYRVVSWRAEDIDKDIVEFPERTRLVGHVSPTHAYAFPEKSPGFFEVQRTRNTSYDFQLYTVLNKDRVYKRQPNTSTGGWSEWKLIFDKKPLTIREGSLGDVSNTSIYDFESVAATYGYVKEEDASSMPEGKAGVLETHRLIGDRFNYQIYRVYDSGAIYQRWRSYSPSKWLPWVKISSPNSPKLESTVDHGSINAHSTKKYTKDLSTIRGSGLVIAQPRSDMPSGISWSYRVADDRILEITLANVTSSDVFVGKKVWRVVAVDSRWADGTE